MGSFLEISKLAIATYLHDKWKETYGLLKIYLVTALVVLSVLTSIGIYGLLSTGFQQNIASLEINNKKIENIEVKKNRFNEIQIDYQKEKEGLDKDITSLRNALSTNTTTQTIDRTTGQVVTRANGGNRKAFETQLSIAQENRDKLSKKIEALNDSITKLDLEVLDLASTEIESGELGAIKYLSEITGWDIKKTANFFILILIFVFDPLAIALVIATNQAFSKKTKPPYFILDNDDDDIVPPHTDDIEIPENYLVIHEKNAEPEVVERIVEVPVEVIREVERIVEIERIVEVPVDRVVEIERFIEVPVEVIREVIREVEVPMVTNVENDDSDELRVLKYTK
jgi:hypothetical protein